MPPADENLMVDNMFNIKETEFLVETSTNLAASQQPSGIFSQNDEHMAQKAPEFGVLNRTVEMLGKKYVALKSGSAKK